MYTYTYTYSQLKCAGVSRYMICISYTCFQVYDMHTRTHTQSVSRYMICIYVHTRKLINISCVCIHNVCMYVCTYVCIHICKWMCVCVCVSWVPTCSGIFRPMCNISTSLSICNMSPSI